MGFDPRRWRPSPGSRPLTTNVEALLAENEALRREVRSLRLQLEAFVGAESAGARPWETGGATSRRAPAAGSPSGTTVEGTWASSARTRSSRAPWSEAEPPHRRVTVGSSHGLSSDLVERWLHSLARHPQWQELRIGPPGGLRGLEQELRQHWWNPGLSLEQELDRRCPGLGTELSAALRGPHSRGRWAVRAAFALYGARAPEWLSEEPLRVVEELLRRVQHLEQRGGTGGRSRGTRTANTSSGSQSAGHGGDHRESSGSHSGADRSAQQSSAGGAGDHRRRAGQRQHRRAGTDPGGQQRSGAGGTAQASAGIAHSQALAVLGLQPGASAAAIKRAYRRLAKAHHPDLGGDAEAFRRLDAAYRSLL